MALEVIWPRHKWDYLTVADPDVPVNPPPLPSTFSTWADASRPRSMLTSPDAVALPDESQEMAPAEVPLTRRRVHRAGRSERSPTSVDTTHQQGRALAVHAFLQGAQCRVRRVCGLLDVSARTVGRDRAQPPLTTPPIFERAQTCIAASADRGSTPEERAAAVAWLTTGAAPATGERGTSIGAEGETAPGGGAPSREVSMIPERQAAPTEAPLTRDQVDACCRLHRRIRVRTDVIRRLLEPDPARDELMEVVQDLLVEIRGATEALETLLQPKA